MNLKQKRTVDAMKLVIADLKKNWNICQEKHYVKDCSSCEAGRTITFLEENIRMIRANV